MESKSVAQMRVWEGVCGPRQVEEKQRVIYARLRSFILAIEFAYGVELKWREMEAKIPNFGDIIEPAVIKERILIGDTLADEVLPAPPPKAMPSLSPSRERFVRTFVEASRFQEYVEEQLRRHYLIIEELWPQLKQQFSKYDGDNENRIKLVRDFVSHPFCDNPKIVGLVEIALPSAIFEQGGKRKVRFLRNSTHRNFVAQHEVVSRDLARRLIERAP